jgi:hypothetical protein
MEFFTSESDELSVPESQVLGAPESQETKEVVTSESELLVVPKSQEPEDVVMPKLEMVMAADSSTPLELHDLVGPDSEVVPDSLPPDSMDVHAQEVAPESQKVCARCHLVHEDRQAWNRVHSQYWPCSRCNLVHEHYRLGAMIYGLDEFDCFVFIPDLDELDMDGRSIKLPPRVLKMLDEKRMRELAAGNAVNRKMEHQ